EEPKLRFEGTSLLARRADVSDWSPVPQQIRSLSAVLPALPVPGDPRPTVIVLHPFLAVGGAERLCYDVMRLLLDDVRFVILTVLRRDAVVVGCCTVRTTHREAVQYRPRYDRPQIPPTYTVRLPGSRLPPLGEPQRLFPGIPYRSLRTAGALRRQWCKFPI